MGLVEKMERRFGGFYVPNLPLFIVGAHILFGLLAAGDPSRLLPLTLIPEKVAAGEIHRLFSFIFLPNTLSLPLLILFSYFYYFFASAAEQAMGAFRFNLLFFGTALGYVLASGIFILFPETFVDGYYLPQSTWILHLITILAFCIHFPRFEIYFMFVLRLEARWLGVIDALLIAHAFLFGTGATRVLILCALTTFSILFGNLFISMVRNYFRRTKYKRDLAQNQTDSWDDDEDEDDEDYDDEDDEDDEY